MIVILLGVGLGSERVSPLVAIAYAALGALAFLTYGLDKRLAETGRWRIPESQLHGLDLLFGVVGGLFGQLAFRHKISKPGFAATTFCIASLHVAGLATLAAGLLG